jgi:RimJ/RimL family protein N-acetyltransferase
MTSEPAIRPYQHLASRGITRLRIGVLAANAAAQRAYARYGFAPYESEMEKPIASPLPLAGEGLR